MAATWHTMAFSGQGASFFAGAWVLQSWHLVQSALAGGRADREDRNQEQRQDMNDSCPHGPTI